MICQQCGNTIGDNASRCPFCGAPAIPTSESSKTIMFFDDEQEPEELLSQERYRVPSVPPQPPLPPQSPQPSPVPVPPPVPPVSTAKKSNMGLIIGLLTGVAVLIVAVVLSIILLDKRDSFENRFYGEWVATFDYTDTFLDSMGEDRKYFDEDYVFELEMNIVFNQDNTYSISVDKSALEQTKKDFRAALKKAMLEAIRQTNSTLSSYSDQELETYLKENMHRDIDDQVDEILAGFDLQQLTKDLYLQGMFQADADKLYFSATKNKDVDPNVYALYQMESETKVTLTKYIVSGVESDSVFPTPFTMEKIA